MFCQFFTWKNEEFDMRVESAHLKFSIGRKQQVTVHKIQLPTESRLNDIDEN